MTTMITPPESAVAGPPRLLSIAANLLPPEVIQGRHSRKVRRRVLSCLAVVVVLLGGWYAVAVYQAEAARASLANAQDEVTALRRQQNQFGDLVRAQTQSKAINDELAQLLANDLQWSKLISSLQQAAPSQVKVTGVTGMLATTPNNANPALPQLPGTGGAKVIGTVSLMGNAPSKTTIAAYLDALGEVDGVANPLLNDVNTAEGTVEFTVRLDITAKALGGRHTATTKQSGGK